MCGCGPAGGRFARVRPKSPPPQASFNVASITKVATGQLRVTFTTAFSSANYATMCMLEITNALSEGRSIKVDSQTSGSVTLNSYNASANLADPTAISVVGFGDQ